MWASGKKVVAGSGGSAFDSRFQATLTGNQSIANDTWTKVSFANEIYDNDSEFDHATNYRFTAGEAGIYHFDSNLIINSPGSAKPYEAVFRKNQSGYSWPGTNDNGIALVSGNRGSMGCDFELDAGDYIEIWIHQYAGAARDLLTASTFSGHRIA
jgi:hypothetical protein